MRGADLCVPVGHRHQFGFGNVDHDRAIVTQLGHLPSGLECRRASEAGEFDVEIGRRGRAAQQLGAMLRGRGLCYGGRLVHHWTMNDRK